MSLFENVKNAVDASGMTIKELERIAGLSNGSIAKWKESAPRIDNLVRVARTLNVDVNDLIGGEDDDETSG